MRKWVKYCFIVSFHRLFFQSGGEKYGDLTEVGRTRPERTMSGVVRGMAESSVPVGSWLWRGNPAGMNSYGDRLHFSKRIAVLNS